MWIVRILSLLLISFETLAQIGTIVGKVTDQSNQAVPFATVRVLQTSLGAVCNESGNYEIKDIPAGTYSLEAYQTGLVKKINFEILVNSGDFIRVDFSLSTDNQLLEAVVITSSAFNKPLESPVSIRTIGATEIKRNAGANRDISKVLQSLPGVSAGTGFRNDLIVRGGAPSENRFYVDGFEIPNINHFATQGSSGGPVGLLNVNFIREVDFISGAFPANKGNALSSIVNIKQLDGRSDRIGGSLALGSSDLAATLEGPIGKNSTFFFSYRKSYLEFLFKALQLPFLPTYNDAEYKQKWRINDTDELTFLALGAIDNFKLNTDANETESQRYLLANLPVNEQWNYSAGVSWRRTKLNKSTLILFSRNQLNNTAIKYRDNIETSDRIIQDYLSTETENKFRIEQDLNRNKLKINYGFGIEQASYFTKTYLVLPVTGILNYSSNLNLLKFQAFGQVSTRIWQERGSISAGLRMDGNSFNSSMSNPLNTLSPRVSFSYQLTTKLSFNSSAGVFYQLPAYTSLGFRNGDGALVNQDLNYINNRQLVGGFEYELTDFSKVTTELFYKKYDQYPVLTQQGVSLANLGSDFGVVGNSAVSSIGKGKSYGLEVLFQQRLNKNFYAIFAYTWSRSYFSGANAVYIPSAWDQIHIISSTAGVLLPRKWEIGGKIRISGGQPYTPYLVATSMDKNNFNQNPRGVLDYSKINSNRLKTFAAFDIRIDKKYNWNKSSLDVFIDVQNLFNTVYTNQPYLSIERDRQGNPLTDPNNSNQYLPKYLLNTSGSVLPSIGIILTY